MSTSSVSSSSLLAPPHPDCPVAPLAHPLPFGEGFTAGDCSWRYSAAEIARSNTARSSRSSSPYTWPECELHFAATKWLKQDGRLRPHEAGLCGGIGTISWIAIISSISSRVSGRTCNISAPHVRLWPCLCRWALRAQAHEPLHWGRAHCVGQKQIDCSK